MIIELGLRCGTHSASAIFREARGIPELQHACRTAPRAWWHGAVRQEGAEYRCHFVTRPFEWNVYYIAGGWVVRSRTVYGPWGDMVLDKLSASGFPAVYVSLAIPWRVYHLAAREIGLSCRRCGEPAKADHFKQDFMCPACERRARLYKDGRLGLLRADINRAAREIRKEARKQALGKPAQV